ERPVAADVESVLRQALVSPVSAPGELEPETTRVLPAMPFRPPSIAITAESELPRDQAAQSKPDLPAGSNASRRIPARIRRPGRRFWTAVVLVILAVGAAAAALTFSLAPQPSPDLVPYPAVTGTLGDHLKELQESVKP
ncbi:MAG TPA: serine/threonine protein kinase, partial [Arthrobacter bacterium]|nr:serine/threonine protein kinase [Arthrobacter sp.]